MNATSIIYLVIDFFYILPKCTESAQQIQSTSNHKKPEESINFQSEFQKLSFKRKQSILLTPVCLFCHAT